MEIEVKRLIESCITSGLIRKATNEVISEMVEDENNFYYRIEVPGFYKEEIDACIISNNVLVVTGKLDKIRLEFVKEFSTHLKEFKFERILPRNACFAKASATLHSGILFIVVPKTTETDLVLLKKIEIQ